MQSNKNTPRSPEEQQRAFEEFLANQESEGPESKTIGSKKKKKSTFSLLRNKKTSANSRSDGTMDVDITPASITEKSNKTKVLPVIRNKKTSDDNPVTQTTRTNLSSCDGSKDNISVTKTTKNQPLSPEEQQKAFEDYLASMEKEKHRKSKRKSIEVLKEDSDIKRNISEPKDVKIAKTTKNQPLSPEEQQKAFEDYLASMEKEKIQADASSEQSKPKSKFRTDRKEKVSPTCVRPIPSKPERNYFEHESSTEKETDNEPEKESKELVIAKTSKNKPLTPEEQQKAFEDYLASMESEKEAKKEAEPEKESKELVIAKTSKNKPLTPEEQQKAFEDYLASMEKEKEAQEEAAQEREPKITKTSKNQPLTPEEQQKAFEDYLASMEKEKEVEKEAAREKEPKITKTSKNQPLTPEEQQQAFEDYLIEMEKEKEEEKSKAAGGLRIKSTTKNRALTPEEQQIALNEFRARQQMESREAKKPSLRMNSGRHSSPKSNRLSKVFSFSSKTFHSNRSSDNIIIPQPEEENFSPLPKGAELTQFLLYNYKIVSASLESAKDTNQTEFVNAILEVFMNNRVELSLILDCLQYDIDHNLSEATLFRDNTSGTQLFSTYCKIKGKKYLEDILSAHLERFTYRRDALEVDTARCSQESAETNTMVLYETVNEILDRVFRSQPLFPQCLGRLFHHLHKMVEAKYPEIGAKIAGGFYFLRFFSPMAVSPKMYGLVDNAVSASCRRSLILCTKIIQNLSNNVPFTKEPYMFPFNGIISARKQEVKSFLESLGNFEKLVDPVDSTTENDRQNMSNKALRIIATTIASNFKFIQNNLEEKYSPEEVHDKLVQLRIIIEQIHNVEPIGWVPPEEVKETSKDEEDADDVDFDISRNAFILLREAFQQCEAELKETKIRLEEETTLRKSMQTIVVQLADSIHSQIDDRVAFKLQQVSEKARESGVDQNFCDEILSLCPPACNSDTEVDSVHDIEGSQTRSRSKAVAEDEAPTIVDQSAGTSDGVLSPPIEHAPSPPGALVPPGEPAPSPPTLTDPAVTDQSGGSSEEDTSLSSKATETADEGPDSLFETETIETTEAAEDNSMELPVETAKRRPAPALANNKSRRLPPQRKMSSENNKSASDTADDLETKVLQEESNSCCDANITEAAIGTIEPKITDEEPHSCEGKAETTEDNFAVAEKSKRRPAPALANPTKSRRPAPALPNKDNSSAPLELLETESTGDAKLENFKEPKGESPTPSVVMEVVLEKQTSEHSEEETIGEPESPKVETSGGESEIKDEPLISAAAITKKPNSPTKKPVTPTRGRGMKVARGKVVGGVRPVSLHSPNIGRALPKPPQ